MQEKPRGFDKTVHQAEKVAQDKDRLRRVIEAASRKASSRKQALRTSAHDFETILRLLWAWISGKYRRLPWRSLVSFVASALYFLNPLDMIPDIIPLFGYLDDITVIGFVIAAFHSDMEDFLQWEEEKEEGSLPGPPQAS